MEPHIKKTSFVFSSWTCSRWSPPSKSQLPSYSFLHSCKGAITCHFSVGFGRGEQESKKFLGFYFFSIGPPLKIPRLQGVPYCSPLPSPTLKWQVIAPLQLCRKDQEGTCDFEGGSTEKKTESQTWGEWFETSRESQNAAHKLFSDKKNVGKKNVSKKMSVKKCR